MTDLVIHTKSLSPCGQCDMTLRFARRAGLTLDERPGIDTPERADDLAFFKEHGLASAPIVEVFDEHGDVVERWAGFRPDKIKEYAA